jgi:hypothetical protein
LLRISANIVIFIVELHLTTLKLFYFGLFVSFAVGSKVAILIKFPSVLHFGGLFIDAFQFSDYLFAGGVILIKVFLFLLQHFCMKRTLACGFGPWFIYFDEFARSLIIGVLVLD